MRFFISSRFEEMKAYRQFTIEYLSDLMYGKTGEISAMEFFAASQDTPVDVCLAEVEKSDVLIGIYGTTYGWVPEGSDISMVEMEFDRAIEMGKTVLAFVTTEDLEEKQSGFIEQKVNSNCTAARFGSLLEFGVVLNDSVKECVKGFEGYSYHSIWDDINLLRARINTAIEAGSLQIPLWEDGKELEAIEEIINASDFLYKMRRLVNIMYFACSESESWVEQPDNLQEILKQAWVAVFIGLPNNINRIRLAAQYLKLTHLQNRLLKEKWTDELRQQILSARDDYIGITDGLCYVD